MMSSERAESSNEKLLKKLENLESENIELSCAKIKLDDELGCYKKKVNELNLRVTQLEGEIQVLMNKQRIVEDEEKNSTLVSNPKKCTIYLPGELIVEILSRLPVKSLLRFSAVCKTWNSLIKCTSFISKHLNQYPLNPKFNCNSLVVFSKFSGYNFNVYETCFSLENAFQKPVQVDFPGLRQTDYLKIVGVSDGLICVSLSGKECDLFMCNPATRQLNRLPLCQHWNNDCFKNENGWAMLGFGIHPSVDDYKVVRITCTDTLSSEFVHRAEIYSMSSDDWSIVDLYIMPFGSKAVSSGISEDDEVAVAINGVFYWVALNSEGTLIVMSFNVNYQVLQLIDFPNCSGHIQPHIIQLKEEVAVVVDTYVEGSFVCDVWVLNASTSCWSKKFIINLPSEIEFSDLWFSGSTENDNIVFQDTKIIVGGETYLYHPTRKEIKRLPFDQDNYFIKGTYCYVESLLPVKKKKQTQRSQGADDIVLWADS